jgi:hypothetical protein
MKLSELNPQYVSGILMFDCPTCTKTDYTHKIRVPLAPTVSNGKSWQHTGEFPDTLTLTPSVNAGCWHGNITNGEVT